MLLWRLHTVDIVDIRIYFMKVLKWQKTFRFVPYALNLYKTVFLYLS